MSRCRSRKSPISWQKGLLACTASKGCRDQHRKRDELSLALTIRYCGGSTCFVRRCGFGKETWRKVLSKSDDAPEEGLAPAVSVYPCMCLNACDYAYDTSATFFVSRQQNDGQILTERGESCMKCVLCCVRFGRLPLWTILRHTCTRFNSPCVATNYLQLR